MIGILVQTLTNCINCSDIMCDYIDYPDPNREYNTTSSENWICAGLT